MRRGSAGAREKMFWGIEKEWAELTRVPCGALPFQGRLLKMLRRPGRRCCRPWSASDGRQRSRCWPRTARRATPWSARTGTSAMRRRPRPPWIAWCFVSLAPLHRSSCFASLPIPQPPPPLSLSLCNPLRAASCIPRRRMRMELEMEMSEDGSASGTAWFGFGPVVREECRRVLWPLCRPALGMTLTGGRRARS